MKHAGGRLDDDRSKQGTLVLVWANGRSAPAGLDCSPGRLPVGPAFLVLAQYRHNVPTCNST